MERPEIGLPALALPKKRCQRPADFGTSYRSLAWGERDNWRARRNSDIMIVITGFAHSQSLILAFQANNFTAPTALNA